MSRAYAYLQVSEEFMAESPALMRSLVREQLRHRLTELGRVVGIVRYRIDPPDLGPPGDGNHLIMAVADVTVPES